MALHPDFPASPHAILALAIRWFPADETLRDTSKEKLLLTLVPELRRQVKAWRRDTGYAVAERLGRKPEIAERGPGGTAGPEEDCGQGGGHLWQ